MTIAVHETPSATWILEDETFYCQHDEDINIEETEVDTLDYRGEHTTYTAPIAICGDPDCDQVIEDYVFDYEDDCEPMEYED